MKLPVKTQHPGRSWYLLFGLGTFMVFALGAAACHALIQADPPDCDMNVIACLFIPTRSDLGVHLVSYALMTPLMAAMFFWFFAWRKQWVHVSRLTSSLSFLRANDDRLDVAAKRLGMEGKVHLLESEDFLCFCAFFLSPRIFVSSSVVGVVTAEELEALLLHEKSHLENRDPLKMFLGRSIVSSLFFAPVLKDLFRRYLIRKEIAADQRAVTYQGQRRGIVGALRKLLEQDSVGRSGVAVTAGATEELKYRINFILGRPDKGRIQLSHLLISSAVPVLALLSIFGPRLVLR